MLNDFKIADNFHLTEFECNHCGVVKIHPRLVNVLQAIRDRLNRPVVVTSGVPV